MIWFTSDWHFCHDREFVWQARNFNSIEEMNQAIVERHNAIVNRNDEVFFLGDALLLNNTRGMALIRQLNGKFHWIWGNHDTEERKQLLSTIPGSTVHGFADVVKLSGVRFYLSHYPTITNLPEYEKPLNSATICLYGHTHQQDKFHNSNPYIYNVGMDAHNCCPVSIDQIIDDIKNAIQE